MRTVRLVVDDTKFTLDAQSDGMASCPSSAGGRQSWSGMPGTLRDRLGRSPADALDIVSAVAWRDGKRAGDTRFKAEELQEGTSIAKSGSLRASRAGRYIGSVAMFRFAMRDLRVTDRSSSKTRGRGARGESRWAMAHTVSSGDGAHEHIFSVFLPSWRSEHPAR